MGSGATLDIARGVHLPAEQFVESKTAIIGISGSGKSGCLKVLEEEIVQAKLPFIVIDPAGIAYGLRSSLDGKGPGFPVLVVGGEHGDIPLNRNAGAEMAREVVRANCSVIFDFSDETESKGSYRKFLADFCDALYVEQGKSGSPRLVIIDEAHEILPQNLPKGMDLTAYGAVMKLVTRGRNRGIGIVLVTQRPAALAKTALTQCETLLIFRILGAPDRKAINEWVSAWGDEQRLKDFDEGLATLQPQECYLWSPIVFKIFRKIRVRDFRTFHADRTHLRKMGLLQVQPVLTDVETLKKRLSIEVTKFRDEKSTAAQVPALLREIRELKAAGTRPAVPVVDPKLKERLELAEAQVKSLHEQAATLGKKVTAYQRWHNQLQKQFEGFPIDATTIGFSAAVAGAPLLRSSPLRPETRERIDRAVERYTKLVPITKAPENGGTEEVHLKAGALRMLSELGSRHPMTMTRSQLGALTGLSPSGGTFGNYWGLLVREKLITEDSDGSVHITEAGIARIGTDVPPAPATHEEAMARWAKAMKKGAFEMLKVIVEAGAQGTTRETIAERTEFAVDGGTFGNYLGLIKRNGLATEEEGILRATDVLFP